MVLSEIIMKIEILIVDDAPFVALDLEDTVLEAGFIALRPCGSVSGALALIERRLPNCAILDINLVDGEVFPVADRLRNAGVPIIFHSGLADTSWVKARYPDAYFCSKPCAHTEILAAIRQALSATTYGGHDRRDDHPDFGVSATAGSRTGVAEIS